MTTPLPDMLTAALAQAAGKPPPDPNGHSPLQAAAQLGLTPRQSAQALAGALGVAAVSDLRSCSVDERFVERVPIAFARRLGVIGLRDAEDQFRIAFHDTAGWQQIDNVARMTGHAAAPLLAPAPAIEAAINAAYQKRTGQAEQFISSLKIESAGDKPTTREDLLDIAHRAPVVKLVNLLLFEAVKQEASDIHIQPGEGALIVRFRLDGVLFNVYDLPGDMQEEIVSRIKVMSRMNIAEKRLPQDGRATVQVGDRLIDLRVSSIPSSHGERLVIRLLDKSAHLYGLTDLGMDKHTLDIFTKIIWLDHGMVLVTGPTGAGKSTTLYASLLQINSQQYNILTLEDPIEYQLPGISQTQVSDKRGMTFSSGLRSVLRQDPDIIMVGEIRDQETASMAIQSALTGHLVFSTLHTNDAPSAITRLIDLGVEPFLVASSLVGVLAQRLVRKVCTNCAAPIHPTPQILAQIGIPPDADIRGMRQGAGCELCHQSGYRGRVGLFELLVVEDSIRQLIQQRDNASSIRQAGIAAGMRTLRDQGVDAVLAGRTTIEEVLRVTLRVDE